MVIYNYCSRCGKRIKIDERDPILSLSLQNTEKAICSDCDKDSKWTPVYSYEVVGRDGEIFIECKIDGWTITGVMMGVNHKPFTTTHIDIISFNASRRKIIK